MRQGAPLVESTHQVGIFEILMSYESMMGMLWLKNTITEKIKQTH